MFFYWFLTGFGLGLFPKMPGTVGTLGMTILCIILYSIFPYYSFIIYTILFALVLGITLIAYPWVFKHDIYYKKRLTSDDGAIVVDEWLGVLLLYMLLPRYSLGWFLLGFVVFRIFDITKPWPIRVIDSKIKNVYGVILDDILAAVYGIIIIYIGYKIYAYLLYKYYIYYYIYHYMHYFSSLG